MVTNRERTGRLGRLMQTAAVAALALGLTGGGAAAAADLALIIDNGPNAVSADADRLADVLEDRGYRVIDRREASREEMGEALREVAERLEGRDRLILAFFGEVRSRAGVTWLMPEDYDGEGWLEAGIEGLSLDVLTRLAARSPGRAAVLVGVPVEAEAGNAEPGFRVSSGIGNPQLPQGVLLIAGRAQRVAAVTSNRLLAPNRSAARAVRELPDGVRATGFVSPDFRFGAPTRARAERRPRSPQPVVVEPAERANPAQQAEAALRLGQAERRRIQERLTVLGYNTRGIDGIFGPGTRGAIGEWQANENFEPTGFLDADQMRELTEVAEARSEELATAAERARREEEAADAEFWRTTGANGGAADLRTYLERYPDGVYAGEARASLNRIEASARAEARTEDRAAWERAEGENSVGSYRNYLDAFPNGAFKDQAEARIVRLTTQPQRNRANQAAAAAESQLGLGEGSRALIEGQLASLGYAVGEADGAFDGQTRRGLRQFQTRQGLEVTGYVNQETVQALIVASLGLR